MLTEQQHRAFWSKVRVNPETGCHEWTASTGTRGYGQFRQGRNTLRTHRVAYELYHGCPPGALLVCHTCDNKRCVRKDHLFLGTAKDNTDDMMGKGRHVVPGGAAWIAAHRLGTPRGGKHPRCRLSDTDIARAFTLAAQGWRQTWIARELGCTSPHISRVLRGKSRAAL